MMAFTPPRCRLCPDGLAELADISAGDAWLERFKGSAGVSDLIVRTPAGEALLKRLAGEHLTLVPAGPCEMLRSQRETHELKRKVWRGRMWLRGWVGRRVPVYPGLPNQARLSDKLVGLRDVAGEVVQRRLAALRFGL